MSEKLTAEKGTLACTVNKLNVRGGSPSTSAPIVGSLKKGETAPYIGYTEGSSVNGNAKWYKGTDNQYYWSGGVKAKRQPVTVPSSDTSEGLSAAVGSGCPNKKDDVTKVQKLLKAKGVDVGVDGLFGPNTRQAIINFQRGALGFRTGDGRVDVGGTTWKGLNDASVKYTKPADNGPSDDFNTKWKDVTIQGSVYPDSPIVTNKRISFNSEIKNEYLPAMEKALAGSSKGMKLLCTIMAFHEGFKKGSRSYRTNNPGNIGNTDAGSNVAIKTLEDGIRRQRDYINRICEGKNSAYPMGKKKVIKPYYSPEIAANPQYGLPAYLPGYEFIFTGQLDQFVKIYATGARAGNSYLSTILSYLIANGMNVNAQSKIQDIVK
ncbi:MAG: peptidoglycan-binding protein [bacterium]|nr:peptidoglycan-binding protein [bacterium]